MTDTLETSQNLQKPSRPTGVWILTIYALIFAGITPLLISVFALLSGNVAGEESSFLLSLPISIGVVTSAISAWKGSKRGRNSLLVFVTLHYALIGINNYLFISSGSIPDEEQTRLWGRVVRGFLYPAVYLWYFNQSTTKEFYE